MKAIAAGFINETGKLFARKKYSASLAVAAVICVAAGFLANWLRQVTGISPVQMPLLLLSILTGYALPMMVSMTVSDFFTCEQENGSIRACMIKPVSRSSIFVSKVLTVELYAAMMLAVCLAAATLAVLFITGKWMGSPGELLIAYAVSLASILPVILFFTLVSQAAKTASSAIILSVLCYLGLRAVCMLSPGLFSVVFVSYTGWYAMFIGSGMPMGSILNAAALLAAYALIFFAGACYLFEKKEY